MPTVEAAREKANYLFDLLHTYLQFHGESVRRLTGEFARDPIWNGGLNVALSDLLGEIRMLKSGLEMVRTRMESARTSQCCH